LNKKQKSQQILLALYCNSPFGDLLRQFADARVGALSFQSFRSTNNLKDLIGNFSLTRFVVD
jgi:hypothetical protein